MDFGLSGRTALVVGADEPVGLACARALAKEGVSLVLAGRDEAELAQAAKALQAPAFAIPAAPGGGQALGARILAAHPVIDIVAVTFAPAPRLVLADLDIEATAFMDAWEELANLAAIYGEAVPDMKARGWGRLVYVGSTAAKALTGSDTVLDRMTGLGMLGLQKTLGGEFGEAGITGNSILYDPALEPKDEVLASVGGACAYLASQPAAYLTGVTMTIDAAMPRGVF